VGPFMQRMRPRHVPTSHITTISSHGVQWSFTSAWKRSRISGLSSCYRRWEIATNGWLRAFMSDPHKRRLRRKHFATTGDTPSQLDQTVTLLACISETRPTHPPRSFAVSLVSNVETVTFELSKSSFPSHIPSSSLTLQRRNVIC